MKSKIIKVKTKSKNYEVHIGTNLIPKLKNILKKNKSNLSINKIHNVLFKYNFYREDCIISFGGGITGDVAGYAASTYKRGIKFVNIPSTLLAQVDSSIGGKTGILSLIHI